MSRPAYAASAAGGPDIAPGAGTTGPSRNRSLNRVGYSAKPVHPAEPMADDPFTLVERLALVDAARAVADSGLIVGAAGNLSVRSAEHLLITPRSARLGQIDPADCVAVAL